MSKKNVFIMRPQVKPEPKKGLWLMADEKGNLYRLPDGSVRSQYQQATAIRQ